MKQGKKLSRKMKELLNKKGLDYENYLLERQDHLSYTFINIKEKKTEIYYK